MYAFLGVFHSARGDILFLQVEQLFLLGAAVLPARGCPKQGDLKNRANLGYTTNPGPAWEAEGHPASQTKHPKQNQI